MSFAKNRGKKLDKIVSKNLSSKYNQKLLHHTKQFPTDKLKVASKNNDSKKQQKQLGNIFVMRLQIKLRKF